MMCPGCGRWAPPDPETGYDVDELCPTCQCLKDEARSDDYFDRRRDEKLVDGDDDKSPF